MSITSFGTLDNLDVTKKGGSISPIEPGSLPGLLPTPYKDAIDLNKFKVRYQKLDMDELGDIAELEKIETKAIRNEGVYVLMKKDFVFMDRVLMLISYLEKDETA